MNKWGKLALVLSAGTGLYWLAERRWSSYSFRDKTVLLTGGSRGLGLVLARQLAEAGARVALCARHPAELDRAREDVATHGQPPLALLCDVTNQEMVAELVRTVEATFGPIEVLINNAGAIAVGPLRTMTRADFEDAMNVHFWGVFNTIQAVLPGMRAQ